MAACTGQIRGALDGARYVESLRDGREVWLDGERIADVTTHPAFAGMVGTLAQLYDLQHAPGYQDRMTFVSPESGNRVSLSYLLPSTPADLLAKRGHAEVWAEQTRGMVGRCPD